MATAAREHVRSRRAIAAAACQVGDPLTEAVCWNGFWLLVTNGEVSASQFTDMACRRLQADGLPESGVETLLGRAVEAADAWAPPAQRAGLREQLAAATRTAAGDARKLAIGFAASAQADDQLATLAAWLAGKDLPAGVSVNAELRASDHVLRLAVAEQAVIMRRRLAARRAAA